MEDVLLYSSLLFITNAMVAFYKKYYMYSFFFGMLTVTSVMVHSNRFDLPHPTAVLDKFAIVCVIASGFYIFLEKVSPENILYSLLILLFFLSSGVLYIYGFLVEDYCFHTDRRVANNYHCLMHILSSAGNHMIAIV